MAAQQTGKPNELAALVGPFWSEAKTAESLGVTPDALAAMASDGDALGLISADGDAVYPVWQFHRQGAVVDVKPDLIPIFRALVDYDSWAVAVFLHSPTSAFGPASSLDWLAQGGPPEAVVDLARVVAREWGAGARV